MKSENVLCAQTVQQKLIQMAIFQMTKCVIVSKMYGNIIIIVIFTV